MNPSFLNGLPIVAADSVSSTDAAPEVKTFGSLNQVKITTNYLIEDLTADEIVENSLKKCLDGSSYGNYEIMSSQKAVPVFGSEEESDHIRAAKALKQISTQQI